MRSRSTRTFALGTVAAVLVVGGAGLGSATIASAAQAERTGSTATRQVDSAKARYDRAMRGIGTQYAKGVGVIYPLVSGTQGSAARADTIQHLETGSKLLAVVESELRRTRAPAPVQKLHRRLTADVDKLRLELVGMIRSLQTNNVVQFETLSGLAALPAVNNTIDLIQLDGYTFLGKSTQTAPCGDC